MTMNVIACIDGSRYARAVAEAATWASLRLESPLSLLHVPNKIAPPVSSDLSGNIGLGSQEQLLVHLSDIDAKQSKQSAERGQQLLDATQAHVLKAGVLANTMQRHGDFIDALVELQPSTRLLVLGRHGANSDVDTPHLGQHVEQATRALHCPMLLTKDYFKAPQKVLFAFDGSDNSRQAVTLLADSQLLAGLEVHLVMVGEDNQEQQDHLKWADILLQQGGMKPIAHLLSGPVEQTLAQYQEQHQTDMMVMGAYGHSRIRQFLLGSTTSAMMRNAKVPLLILR